MLKIGLLNFVSLYSSFLFAATKVACIGDSITYGAGIEEREQFSYPSQLGEMLGGDFVVQNFGVNGSTMLKKSDRPFVKEPEYQNAIFFSPKIVIISLGTNDSKTQNWKNSQEFVADYKEFIHVFKALSSVKKILLGLPPPAFSHSWNIDPIVIQNSVVPLIKQIAKEENLQTVDFFTLFQGKEFFFPDKIHPNAEGATLMAELVYGMMIFN